MLPAVSLLSCGCTQSERHLPDSAVSTEDVDNASSASALSAPVEKPGMSRHTENPDRPDTPSEPASADTVDGQDTINQHRMEVSSTAVPGTGQPLHAAAERRSQLRLPDDRPAISDATLNEFGIRVYRSRRLILLSDLPEDQVTTLPKIADQLFDALESALGPLLPAESGADFQVTGCLIDARERFEQAGLMPPEEFPIRHGRHLNYRFWMFNPTTDYYRRHLLLHEFTHCFMSCEHGMRDIPPLWYTEGIAEYFATHELPDSQPGDDDGQGEAGIQKTVRFGILPGSTSLFPGWGRISEIRRSFNSDPETEVADAGFTPLHIVLNPPGGLLTEDSQYAHAWALFWMLKNNAVYQKEFAKLLPVRSGQEFVACTAMIPDSTLDRLKIDWLLTLDSLTEGFDAGRCFPVRKGLPNQNAILPTAQSVQLEVTAEHGWQHSGFILKSGQTVLLTAQGRFQIGETTKPWISEPPGVTLKYHRGRPLGELVALLTAPDGSFASRRIPIGTGARLTVPCDLELWLQLNESAAERVDNRGSVSVTLTRTDGTSP